MTGRLAWVAALTVIANAAQAHLMPAQQGTLNLQGDGAYLVLSLPVSGLIAAVDGRVDDDGDGRLNRAELQAHRSAIEAMLQSRLRLNHGSSALPLQGLMLDLAPPDDSPDAPAAQLLVLGRYRLPADAAQVHGLRWAVALFGRDRSEQQYTLTVTRGTESQTLLLKADHADRAEAPLLPTRAVDRAGPVARSVVPAMLALALVATAWRLVRRRPAASASA